MQNDLAFDIDGIISNFSQPFLVWAEQEYGLAFKQGNKFNWGCDQKIPDKAFQRIIAEFIRDHSYLIKPLNDGATLVRYMWTKTAKPITFVTARDYSTIQATHDWMRFHFPDVDSIIITVRSGKDKWRYLDNFDCYIEDRRRTVLDLAAGSQKIVFMPARRYNTLNTDEAQAFIKKHGINIACKETKDIHKKTIVYIQDCDDIINGDFDHLIFKP